MRCDWCFAPAFDKIARECGLSVKRIFVFWFVVWRKKSAKNGIFDAKKSDFVCKFSIEKKPIEKLKDEKICHLWTIAADWYGKDESNTRPSTTDTSTRKMGANKCVRYSILKMAGSMRSNTSILITQLVLHYSATLNYIKWAIEKERKKYARNFSS